MDDLNEDTPVYKAPTVPVDLPTSPAIHSGDTIKSSEAMLYRAERLRPAFRAARMLAWDWDLVASYSEFSEDYYKFFGFDGPIPAGPGEDQTLLVVHPDDRAAIREASILAIQNGVAFEVQFRGSFVGEGGRPNWYASRGEISYDHEGHPTRMVGVTWDITGAKRVEEELEKHQGILESLGANLPDSVLLQMSKGPHGEDYFTYLSAGSKRLLDIDSSLVPVGVSAFADKLIDHDAARLWVALDSAVTNQTNVEIDLKMSTSGGKVRRLLLRAAPRALDGEGNVFDGIITDLTEHYANQEAKSAIQQRMWELQKVESLGVLAGGIAHEFNNFLTSIMGHASLMQEKMDPDSPFQESTESILNASVHAKQLCRQMLFYAGKNDVPVEAVDLNEAVRNSIDLLRVSVPRTISVVPLTSDKIPPASAEPTQISQILMNLVLNASEAIVGKAGKISIVTGQDEDAQRVWLEVSDTGCGMTAEVLRRMFEPFFSTKFAGRGLGLAATKGIVDSLNGSLEVATEVGQGTRIRVLLPIATSKPKHRPKKPTPKPAGKDFRGSGTVLVVDDEEWGREVLVAMLRPFGFSVDVAYDGEDAINKVHQKNGHYRVVFLDLTMPNRSGQSVFESLRVSYPALPVIVMSGLERMKVAKMFGGTAPQFLEKPFTMDQVTQALQQALEVEGS